MNGAAPVARIVDLPRREREVIVFLRLWCAGPVGQAEVWQELAARLGHDQAASALERFEALLLATARLARRPLARHCIGCPCAGADECAFARLVALAGSPEDADARMLAVLIAGAKGAEPLAAAAEAFCRALAGARETPRTARGAAATLH
ncbi:hypothetical protein BH23PSE1_BH23PSE1_11840 [soil metagenome]